MLGRRKSPPSPGPPCAYLCPSSAASIASVIVFDSSRANKIKSKPRLETFRSLSDQGSEAVTVVTSGDLCSGEISFYTTRPQVASQHSLSRAMKKISAVMNRLTDVGICTH